MEALVRIGNIPIVETGVKTAGNVYFSLKVTNSRLVFIFVYSYLEFKLNRNEMVC